MKHRAPSFFDLEKQFDKIYEINNFLSKLKQHGIEQQLFDRFHQELEAHGFGINSGLIVDSTFVEVPRQHNTREENEQIRAHSKLV